MHDLKIKYVESYVNAKNLINKYPGPLLEWHLLQKHK